MPPHSILALAVTWSLHSLFNVNLFHLPLAKINGSTDTHAHIINSTHRDCNTSKKLYRWLNSLEGSIIKGFVALMYGTNHSLLYSIISFRGDWITITVTTVLLLKLNTFVCCNCPGVICFDDLDYSYTVYTHEGQQHLPCLFGGRRLYLIVCTARKKVFVWQI